MQDPSTRSTGELIGQALDDFLALLRKEFELLKQGLVDTVTDRLKGAGLIALAGIVVFPGLLFVFVAIALWLPGSPALGFMMLGGFLLVLAGVAIWWGTRLLKKGGKRSTEALDKVKEDARWARERVTR